MKLILLVSLAVFSLAQANAAGTICEDEKWRKSTIEHPNDPYKGKTYGDTYCKKNDNNWWVPSEAMDNLVDGNAKEVIKASGGFLGICTKNCKKNSKAIFDEIYGVKIAGKKPAEARDTSSTLVGLQIRSSQLDQAVDNAETDFKGVVSSLSEAEDKDRRIAGAINSLGLKDSPESLGIKDGQFPEVCLDNCLKVQQAFLSQRAAELQEQKTRIEQVKDTRKKVESNADELVKDLNQVYEGKFQSLALNELKKAGADIKDVSDIETVCKETLGSTNDKAKKILETCDDLKSKTQDLEKLKEKTEGIAKKIKKSSDLDFLLAKVDFEGLKVSEDQKEIARKELDKQAQKKLKGTVLGRMMDQMRGDMCNVALNPSFMCGENPYATSLLIDDVGRVLDPGKDNVDPLNRENFRSRKIGGSAAQSN